MYNLDKSKIFLKNLSLWMYIECDKFKRAFSSHAYPQPSLNKIFHFNCKKYSQLHHKLFTATFLSQSHEPKFIDLRHPNVSKK